MVRGCYVQPYQPEVDVGQRMRNDHVTQFTVDLEPGPVSPRRRDVVGHVTVLFEVKVMDA